MSSRHSSISEKDYASILLGAYRITPTFVIEAIHAKGFDIVLTGNNIRELVRAETGWDAGWNYYGVTFPNYQGYRRIWSSLQGGSNILVTKSAMLMITPWVKSPKKKTFNKSIKLKFLTYSLMGDFTQTLPMNIMLKVSESISMNEVKFSQKLLKPPLILKRFLVVNPVNFLKERSLIMLRVIYASPHQGMLSFLNQQPHLQIICFLEQREHLYPACEQFQPDVLLVSEELPGETSSP